ncbi:uncharacterized protein L3040_001645 [Drepanopeziza brunnea f. sp. 'multigermtubi']|uniref:uncharacterized protein n=1 Tax=Drepanopeziza brunnea f. sp. 'multigermtubi' TaxID=698441 RepID=UPI00238322DC|nr:hypothetical protein L3040_001645 [Drepanopeziza brunnea f. sp. 'multigermtubi']
MMDEPRKGKVIRSAFDSTTFDADVSIHVERKVGSATISPSGRDVALASTDGLDIIDLDHPLNPPRHLRHGLPWLVADVQWSPFAARENWVVSTANQKALVWNLNMPEESSQGAIEHTLSIKFWDYGNDIDEPERIIRTDFPVWRARHTPFGWGVLAMPQDTPGNLHLYDCRLSGGDKDSYAHAVTKFPGHGAFKVKEFLWRSRGNIDDGIDNREFQLVSWGEDNQLRLQHVDPASLQAVGYVKGAQVRKKLNVTRKGAVYKTFRTVETTSTEKRAATITGPRPGSSGLKISALSTGMKKVNVPHPARTHMILRASAMKGREKSCKQDDQNQKQIGWMSGIKFAAKVDSTSLKRPTSRRLSLLDPEFDEDGDWGQPESLHDEIIRIHDQLPKITFEDVNMDNRTVVASMNGPWGHDGNAIYIKITIVFPAQYPESKAPSFTLGKTSLMPNDTYAKLKREVHLIAASFVPRKEGCLDAVLCYLLGEVDLETSTTFFKDFGDLDDDMDALADESSSEDDEGDDPPMIASQEIGQTVTGLRPPTRYSNANVPLPRLCGARFSANGKLTCFFPPKEEKVKSLLETLVVKNNARSKGDPVFETFGRLNNNTSPIPRIKAMSLASESKTDSEVSDDSGESSSSDSDSSHFRIARFPMSDYFRRTGRRQFRKGSPTVLSQRSSAGGTGTGTGTGTGLGRVRSSKPKNLLSLHDISCLLPSKPALAKTYAIFGDGPDVCEHNAKAAQKQGYKELADIWRYAAILLHNEVPLEVLKQTHRNEPLLVIAKEAVRKKTEAVMSKRRSSGSDSGVDVSHDCSTREDRLSGRVKWGTNPIARDLIGNLFAYFERLADVQMLAMLSCIFSEPLARDAASHAETQLSQPRTPLSMKTPAFSLDYFPSDTAAWSMYQKTPITSLVSTPRVAHTPSGLYGSVGSSIGAWGSDPALTPYSCGETPPLRSNRASLEYLNQQQTQSLSTSPENPRSFRRSNSGIAHSFAASFSRPFSTTAPSSPPYPPSRKRPSPVENMLNSLAPSAITWGNTTVLGSVKEQSITDRSTYSDEESNKIDCKSPICTGISLTMGNQNVFDDEGCMSTPLLDTRQTVLYADYRKVYAELLYIWGHPLARLEILKFNGLKDYFTETEMPHNKPLAPSIHSIDAQALNQDSPPPSPIILGKIDQYQQMSPLLNAGFGLDVTGYCLKHETRLEPLAGTKFGGAVGHCERCKITQRQLRCTICLEPISAVFAPCLSCGCATHVDCLSDYHASGDTMCPGGCDCDCEISAADGQFESWEALKDALERLREMEAKSKAAGLVEKHIPDHWDGKDQPDGEAYTPDGGLGKPYSTLSRLGQARGGEWGISGLKHKPSSLRNEHF